MDLFTKICLFLTQIYPLIAIVAFGYLFINRKLFGQVIVIMAFTLIFNRFLKSIFQVPLPPTVGHSGWAFPSGHMQLTFAVWGWIAWHYRYKWFWAILAIFLTGVGVGLVYQGYHYPRDVPAAIFFASLSLVGFNYFFKSEWVKKYMGYGLILLMLVGGVLMSLIPSVLMMPTPFLGWGSLWGAYLGWYIRSTVKETALEQVARSLRYQLLELVGLAVGVIPLFWLGFLIRGNINEVIFQFFFGFLLTAWSTGGGLLLAYVWRRKTS